MKPRPCPASADLRVEIISDAKSWEELTDVSALITRASQTAFAAANVQPEGEISVLLTDDAHMSRLNQDFRGKSGATNVLSFPGTMKGQWGDIAIAYETLAREATAEDKSLNDHLTHLMIHGTLHLLGYDHEDETEAEQMEAMEISALKHLGIADPYLRPGDQAQRDQAQGDLADE